MYGGLQYNAIVYEGYLPSNPLIENPPVKSNVIDIDDSSGRLGCGIYSFFITSRCAGTLLCVLDEAAITSASWGRVLDDVSQAEVVLQLSGDATATCCACLAEVEPWCHELHVWRNGEEVWVGPIQELEYNYDKVTVRAKDSLAWLSVRVPQLTVNYTVSTGGLGAADLTTIAQAILNVALVQDDPDYTCELDNVYAAPTGRVEQRFFDRYNQTALEMLQDLSETGIDFTTLGRTIVLVGDSDPLTPLLILNDEHIMGELEVTKDGTLQGNKYFVHFEEDEGIPVESDDVPFYCYTRIERVRDGDGLTNGADALIAANAYAGVAAIAPRSLVIPDGSKLTPDTPWTINEMVPGARVDAAVTRLCLQLTQSFRLSAVQVDYTPEDGESVGITLTPISNTVEDG